MAETIPSQEPVGDARAVKVGVLLAPVPDATGEWLADAAAFDAAGADALWVDSTQQPGWDVLALTAALSVVTFRSLLVVAAPDSAQQREELARTLATIERLSGGRLALIADPGRDLTSLAPATVLFRRGGEPATFERSGGEAEPERWVSMPFPEGRQAWQAARTEAAESGVRGLLVPADPRLLDVLRNPDDPGDRRDLSLAQG